MSIKEIRKEFKNKIEFSKLVNNGLEAYFEEILKTFEDLYKNGSTTNFSNDFLRFANGYQTTTGEYENLHILQTLDLHRISATKAVVREMMIKFLG